MITSTGYASRKDQSNAEYRLHHKLLKHTILTPQEERELIKKYQTNDDRRALDVLVSHNLRFVHTVVIKYAQPKHDIFWDLFNEGCLGLLDAASRFDTNTEYKFISYAVWWVRQRINKYLNMHGNLVRIKQKGLDAIKQDLIANLHEDDPLRKRLVNNKKSDFHLASTVQYYSLDMPDPETGSTLAERLPAPEAQSTAQNQHMLKRLYLEMPEREWEILTNYFGVDERSANLAELGERYGCSRERIRQLKEQALRRAEKILKSMGYKPHDMDVEV